MKFSLIIFIATLQCNAWVVNDLKRLQGAVSKDFDRPAQVPRLVYVLTGCTRSIVGIALSRLNCLTVTILREPYRITHVIIRHVK